MRAQHLDRVAPAVAKEPAPELHRIENAPVPAYALDPDVRLVPLKIGQPIEPGVGTHP